MASTKAAWRRLWCVAVLLAAVLPSAPVAALSPGDIVVESRPGEPLRATIPLTLDSGESLAQLRVSPASEAVYAERGVERPALLEGMRVALLARGERQARLQLFGATPWQGEEAVVLLQMRWPQGELEQRYRIAPVVQQGQTPLYVEVGENESIAAIAIRLSKHSNRSYRHMMVALYRANPEAFYRDNINNLKGGVTLRVPTEEELFSLSDGEVTRILAEHKARWQAPRRQQAQRQAETERLVQQLEQVNRESEEFEQRNRELQERLARLEQQMSSVSQQVIDYGRLAPEQTEPAPEGDGVASAADEAEREPSEPAAQTEMPAQGDKSGLSGGVLLLLMLLVVAAAAILWRLSPRGKGGE
ncbi:MAG: type IV pilus assembly protein FimV [Pseudomonadota bacterium]